jgi:hypothetical protein
MPNQTPDTSGRLDEPPVTEGLAWTVKKLLDSRTRHASRRHLCGIQLVHVLFKDSAERIQGPGTLSRCWTVLKDSASACWTSSGQPICWPPIA